VTSCIEGIYVRVAKPAPVDERSTSLEDTNSPFRLLAENIPQLVWLAMADGSIDYANGKLLDYLGLRGASMDDQAWKDALHPEDVSRWSESWASAVESGLPMEMDVRIRSSKSSYSRYTTQCEPIGNGENTTVCWLVICSEGSGIEGSTIEVSSSVSSDPSLHESEVFVRDLLNSLPEHIVVLDEDGVVCLVNESWERFGRENAALTTTIAVGVNYLDVCRRSSLAGDSAAAEVLEQLEDLLGGRMEQCVVEYPCHAPNRQRWFLMHARVCSTVHEVPFSVTLTLPNASLQKMRCVKARSVFE
jgi:PAS domain-containing protein